MASFFAFNPIIPISADDFMLYGFDLINVSAIKKISQKSLLRFLINKTNYFKNAFFLDKT